MKKIICENSNKNKVEFTYDFPFFLSTANGLYEKLVQFRQFQVPLE